MRILITGATGFVGRHLLAECGRRGDSLVGTHLPGEAVPSGTDAAWRAVDVLDDAALDAVLTETRPDGVIHLAGQANVSLAHRDPVGTFRVNAEGTYRLLHRLRDVAPAARVVVVTSAEVYGAVPLEELPVTEDRPLRPRSPYGVSKAAADLVAEQAATGWGLSVIRMRPFNHVGPGQGLGFVVPDFASQIAAVEREAGEGVLRVGNLSARRDFTDVRDIVRAYRDALERGTPGAAYNLCSGWSISIEEIVRILVGHARKEIRLETEQSRLRPVDVPEFRGDASLAGGELGWQPGIPLETSLAEVLAEWRAAAAAAPHLAD